jgi:hypothetical protein
MLPPIYDTERVVQKQTTTEDYENPRPKDLKQLFAQGAIRLPKNGIDTLVFWDSFESPATDRYKCIPSLKYLVDKGDLTKEEMDEISKGMSNGVYMIPFGNNVFHYDLETSFGKTCKHIALPINKEMTDCRVSVIYGGRRLNNVPWSYIRGDKFAEHCQNFIDITNGMYAKDPKNVQSQIYQVLPYVVVHTYSLSIK